MQASHTWEPPGGTLGLILEQTRSRIASIEAGSAQQRAVEAPGNQARPHRDGSGDTSYSLSQALRREHVAVIGELKRRSPSKGVLNQALGTDQVLAFERGGAAAVSVLTEPRHFGGSLDDLRAVRAAVRLPVVRKDFHVAPTQLHEARNAGADAVLLIARALSPEHLPLMLRAATEAALEALVEVRTEWELERALDAGARIVGVNSRDLETLAVDESVPARLVPMIPGDVVAVWESGVRTADDVRRAAASGADAVLVGSALSQAVDAEQLVRALSAVPRVPRD